MTLRNADGSLACICHEHRPVCDCTPLAPNPDQVRFMRLHLGVMASWRWHFCEALMRATDSRGRSAAIWRCHLDELIAAGLMAQGWGFSWLLTEAGKKVLT